MTFQTVQIVYWLALSGWFGAVLSVAVAAPVIFRTIRSANPILPSVLSVNLEGQHGSLLSGMVVADVLRQFRRVQLICGVALLVSVIAQLFIVDFRGDHGIAAGVRGLLLLVCVGLLLFDWLVVAPRIDEARNTYIENADEPDIANPAKDRFDVEHRRSVLVLQLLLFALLGMILFSGVIVPKARGITGEGQGSVERSR